MKALNYKTKIIMALLLFAGTSLYAKDLKKEFHKEFNTNKATVLNIDVKFCDITVQNWDKNQAAIDVTIESNHSDEAKAKKILSMIDVIVEQKGNEILIDTDFDVDFNKIESAIGKKFSIVIVIKVPSNIGVVFSNKFGSSKLESFSGDFNFSSSFGRTEIEQLSGSNISIEVSQSDCSIGNITNAQIEMNFGSMHIQKAENLDLELNQGEVKLGTVKNISAEISMGNFIVDLVDPSFETIEIELNTGNIELGVDKNAGFSIDAEMKMGNLDLPRELGSVVKGKMAMNSSFEGKYGNGKSTISVEGNLGNIELKLK